MTDVLRSASAPLVAERRALDRIRRALASGAALKAVLGPDETGLRQQADDIVERYRGDKCRKPRRMPRA